MTHHWSSLSWISSLWESGSLGQMHKKYCSIWNLANQREVACFHRHPPASSYPHKIWIWNLPSERRETENMWGNGCEGWRMKKRKKTKVGALRNFWIRNSYASALFSFYILFFRLFLALPFCMFNMLLLLVALWGILCAECRKLDVLSPMSNLVAGENWIHTFTSIKSKEKKNWWKLNPLFTFIKTQLETLGSMPTILFLFTRATIWKLLFLLHGK